MKASTEYTTAHAQDIAWEKNLAFYKQEMEYLRNRVGKLKESISLFENELNQQSFKAAVIDQEIQLREHAMATHLKLHPDEFKEKATPLFADLQEQMEHFEHSFALLKKSFHSFLVDKK